MSQVRGKLLGVVGFAGCGKSTVQQHLVKKNWKPVNFGSALKDVVAQMFDWPRHMLEGDTEESRRWRETKDEYWHEKLQGKFGDQDFTPRRAMQIVGTDLIRNQLDQKFWVYRLQAMIEKELAQGRDVVVGDVRFGEEIDMIRGMGGYVWRVRRGKDPEDLSKLHRSEVAWMASEIDLTIENLGTMEDLYGLVDAELDRLS